MTCPAILEPASTVQKLLRDEKIDLVRRAIEDIYFIFLGDI